MEWNDPPGSALMQQLNANTLQHPTNEKFDPEAWRKALLQLENPSERDLHLTISAIHFGRELASLRENRIPQTIEGYNRTRLLRLLAAFANQQYLTLRDKVRKELKTHKTGGVFNMNSALQMHVEGAGGQRMAPDDLITYLVDSLPHWLFHIWHVPDSARFEPSLPVIDFAARASEITSIEHSLRQLWQNALWLGTKIIDDEDHLLDTPSDRLLAERWLVFSDRQTMLLTAEHHLDAGAHIVSGGKLKPVVPPNCRTVIRIERPPSGKRKFIIGRASGAKAEQRDHASEQDILDRLYTGHFMDETLPKSPGGDLTCRELSKAWWVLQDLGRLTADQLGIAWIANEAAVDRFAVSVERPRLVAIFGECLGIDGERSTSIVRWFTCDPTNTGRLFAKSFWSQPLLPEPCSDLLHIILAPLLTGSPVKRIEEWMQRGGISDSNGIKGRGKPFERYVRTKLAEAIHSNHLLEDAVVAPHGLKRKNETEEIDLLVRIGDSVIVGEVKCLAAPSEPLESHNLLRNLSRATEQARDKAAWAENNRSVIAAAFGVGDPKRAAAFKFYPLVVLNHGFGMGLERHNVPIIDLHYLKLLLGSGSYQGDTRFEKDVGMTYESVELYRSQGDLESKLEDRLRNPPPLKRYEGRARWHKQPFPTSNRKRFLIELPYLDEPVSNVLRDLPLSKPPRQRWPKGP